MVATRYGSTARERHSSLQVLRQLIVLHVVLHQQYVQLLVAVHLDPPHFSTATGADEGVYSAGPTCASACMHGAWQHVCHVPLHSHAS